MLDVGMCAYHILVLPAQPFSIELSTSLPQEIDCNYCLGNHIHFLALFVLVSSSHAYAIPMSGHSSQQLYKICKLVTLLNVLQLQLGNIHRNTAAFHMPCATQSALFRPGICSILGNSNYHFFFQKKYSIYFTLRALHL